MGLFSRKKNDPQITVSVSITPEPSTYVYVPPEDDRKAICPNCQGELKKVPGSKTKCPHCGFYMFVRTDPHTRRRLVVTEAQAEAIDDEIAKLNGTYEIRLAEKKRKEKVKADLTKSFKGKEPSEQDIEWRILNQDSIKYARSKDWISYMLIRGHMADILAKNGKDKDALRTYIEVAFLAINGASDVSIGLGMDAKTKKEWGLIEFNPGDEASLSYFPTRELAAVISNLELSDQDIRAEFESICTSKRLAGLPLKFDSAWPLIQEMLKPQT